MKGRSVQYHSNISKDEGRIFYDKFTALCEVFYFYVIKVVEHVICMAGIVWIEPQDLCLWLRT